jgi:GNAT superfamily N-acetyltransferase
MSAPLQMHAASHDEQAAAHANVFDIWSKGLPLDQHIEGRLNSPKHKLAQWYVGVLDGRVVVSLGCYPLTFRWNGQAVPGIAIGSVYTVKEVRGRGFAPQLIDWVENHERTGGAKLAVLYCDIQPEYYARLGYELCPSLQGWTDPRSIAIEQPRHHVEPIEPDQHLDRLMDLYDRYHGKMPLSIARDRQYWQNLLDRAPGERFFRLTDTKDGWHGYLRLATGDTAWRVTDFALDDQSLELAEDLYGSALLAAQAEGCQRFGGWLPDHPSARQFFDLTPRQVEITMLKSLDPARKLEPEAIELTSRFCEIDHV